MSRDRVSGLLLAAGAGERVGAAKAFLALDGVTLLERVAASLARVSDELVVGVPASEVGSAESLLSDVGGRVVVVPGGATRHTTLLALLERASGAVVVLHEVARPFASDALLDEVVRVGRATGAAAPCVPASPGDALALRDGPHLGAALPREDAVRLQTPQAYASDVLRKACAAAGRDAERFQSTAQLVAAAGFPVTLLPGEDGNRKLTVPEDLAASGVTRRARPTSGAA